MADADDALARAESLVRADRLAEALAAAEALLRAEPDNDRAHIVRINAANGLGDLPRTIDSLQALLRRYPRHPQFTRLLATAINNRGSAQCQRGDRQAACTDFERATEIYPDHPLAWFNLGLALRDLGRPEAARAAFLRHLDIAPDDGAARLLLAGVSETDQAERILVALGADACSSLDPAWLAHSAARGGLIDIAVAALERLSPQHDLDAAVEALSELHQRGETAAIAATAPRLPPLLRDRDQPALRAELIAELALPAIYAGRDEIEQWRARFSQGLDRLDDAWQPAVLAQTGSALRSLAHSNFLLAYQGLPDRDLQVRFARLIERAAGIMQPRLAEPPPARRSRGRIGLLSSCWRQCTVGVYFSGWIDWLREAGYHVALYQLGPRRDAQTERFGALASTFRYLEQPIETVAEIVRADDLDLLIYPELGMDARLTPMAALRLAQRQAVAWGHPTSSGFSTIDDYLSCAPMEPDGAERHYSERLVLLPGLGVQYLQPPVPKALPAADVGLDPDRPRVLIPQSLFKLHPDGDAVLVEIAERLPDVQFVLFESERPRWRDLYVQRLRNAFAARGGEADRHLSFLPLGSRERYLQVNLACDAMLDSLHWSGGNTAIDALCCGLPVVACPGETMRGRQSAAMLQRLGVNDRLATATPSAQAARLAEVVGDADTLRRQILDGLPTLFDPREAKAAFLAWVAGALDR